MPPVIMSIKMDGNSMIARTYKTMKHLREDTLIDYWECSAVLVDESVMTYFEENKLTAMMLKRHRSKGADHDSHLKVDN
jgi:hypothetical protein